MSRFFLVAFALFLSSSLQADTKFHTDKVYNTVARIWESTFRDKNRFGKWDYSVLTTRTYQDTRSGKVVAYVEHVRMHESSDDGSYSVWVTNYDNSSYNPLYKHLPEKIESVEFLGGGKAQLKTSNGFIITYTEEKSKLKAKLMKVFSNGEKKEHEEVSEIKLDGPIRSYKKNHY